MAKVWKPISTLAVLGLVLAVGIGALPVTRTAEASGPLCNCGDICANTTGWWHGGGNFNASSTPLQDAVNNATAGDTICVKDGTYSENIRVNVARLTIKSENGAAKCVVSASNPNDHVFFVTADRVNIAGFTVQDAAGLTQAGIYLKRADRCNVSSNDVLNNRYGVYVFSSSYNAITSNNARDNDYGIYLDSSSNNAIASNNARDNDYGIYLDSSCGNALADNNARDNDHGIYLDSSSNNALTNNNANSNNGHGIWLRYSNNSLITSNNALNNTNDGIRLSSSSSNTLTDNTASDNRYGIYLSSSSSNTLTGNYASNKFSGIRLDSSRNNTLTSNKANLNGGHGIWLYYSRNNTLTDNNATNNGFGIRLYYSCNNTLTNNIMSANMYNFYVYGANLSQYNHSIDTSNKVDGKSIYYWVNHRDEQVPGDAGFVGIVDSTNITVKDLNLTKNGQGVLFVYTESSVVENVTASNNYRDGIRLFSSSNNTIANNTATNNYWGIRLSSSTNNTITHNNVNRNNPHGIDLSSSTNNTIYLNNFIDNTDNVYSSNSTNTWNPGEEINYAYNGSTFDNYLGNYWSGYSGSDPDGDGVGNSPHGILGCCPPDDDNYPLMEPFENYQPVPSATPPARVTDLAVTKTTASSITLTWTAPGDDGNSGTASRYDIRYSTSVINEASWDLASRCAGEPEPQPVGSSETFTVTRRSPGTTFYLALKTADEVSAWSQLSNVVRGTTWSAGGGGAPLPSLEIELPGETESYSLGDSCECTAEVNIASEDGLIVMNVAEGTVVLDRNGGCLEDIAARVNQTPPSLPEGAYLIGSAYDFTPDGASFSPPISLTLKYDDMALPEGLEEKNLVIAYYDKENNAWKGLGCSRDMENNTVRASVSHFTTFAIIGGEAILPPASAEFTITSFDLSREQVKPGESVTISVNVTNIGGSEGSYTLNLTVNGEAEQTKTVTMAPQATETVAFTITREEPGSYSVSIDGLTGEFTVTPPRLSRYWWAIIVGIIAAGLLIHFLVFRGKRPRLTTAK